MKSQLEVKFISRINKQLMNALCMVLERCFLLKDIYREMYMTNGIKDNRKPNNQWKTERIE